MQDEVARLIDALARPAGGSSDFDLVPPFVPPSGRTLRPAADADLESTALREAWEEIALPPAQVEILGRLSGHETVTNYQMTPILGLVRDDFVPIAEVSEVEEVFSVPLSHVLDKARYVIEGRMWMGTRRRYFAVPYGPYYIWGATARILRGLAERVSP